MRLTKYTIAIFLCVLFISGCNNVKKFVTGQDVKKTDEFLVKKKNPLILPPDFEELPKPQQKNNEIQVKEENIDFSSVLKESNNKEKKAKKNNSSLEKSISSILNSN
jgi:hypothetical protein